MRVSVEKPGSPAEVLEHFGKKGMKWGIRRERTSSDALKKQATQTFMKKAEPVGIAVLNRMFDLSPISKHEYSKMSTKSTSIPAGKTLYRLTRTPKDTSLSGISFVTTNKRDATIYRGLLPAQRLFNPIRKSDYKQHYELALKTTKTLRGPSEKERIDILAGLMRDKTAIGGKMSLRQYYKKTKVISRKDAKNKTDLELALQVHRRVHQSMWIRNNPISKSYVNAVTKKGYGMLNDDNDSGIVSKNPIIILNPHSTTKLIKTTTLSNDDILNAQINLRFPKSK